jgi:hypothetical protein
MCGSRDSGQLATMSDGTGVQLGRAVGVLVDVGGEAELPRHQGCCAYVHGCRAGLRPFGWRDGHWGSARQPPISSRR